MKYYKCTICGQTYPYPVQRDECFKNHETRPSTKPTVSRKNLEDLVDSVSWYGDRGSESVGDGVDSVVSAIVPYLEEQGVNVED